MYRSVAYLSRQQTMRLFTWNEKGERIHVDLPYNPYYYKEIDPKRKGERTSLFNTPLKKVEFENEYRRRESIARQKEDKRYSSETEVRIFENVSPPQQFLIDQYWEQNSTPEFSKFPIKIMFLDIETYSPDAFPDPDKANDTIKKGLCKTVLSKSKTTKRAKTAMLTAAAPYILADVISELLAFL